MNTRAIVILMPVKSIYFGLECEHVWDIDDYIALIGKIMASVQREAPLCSGGEMARYGAYVE